MSEQREGTLFVAMGPPGSGKTSGIRHCPKDQTYIITSEPRGLKVLRQWGWHHPHMVTCQLYQEWMTALTHIPKDMQYVVIDSVSGLRECLWHEYHINAKLRGEKLPKDKRQIYGEVGERWKTIVWGLVGLADNGARVIVLCHQKEVDVVDSKGKVISTKQVPDLHGTLDQFLGRNADIIVRHAVHSSVNGSEYLVTAKAEQGSFGKDPSGTLTRWEPNDYVGLIDTIHASLNNTEGGTPTSDISTTPTQPPSPNTEPSEKKVKNKEAILKTCVKLGKEMGYAEPAVRSWLKNRTGVESRDLFKVTTKQLKEFRTYLKQLKKEYDDERVSRLNTKDGAGAGEKEGSKLCSGGAVVRDPGVGRDKVVGAEQPPDA